MAAAKSTTWMDTIANDMKQLIETKKGTSVKKVAKQAQSLLKADEFVFAVEQF